MTAQILFHPQLKAIDAARIAREQGGRLVWRSARQRLKQAMQTPTRLLSPQKPRTTTTRCSTCALRVPRSKEMCRR